MDKRAWGLLFIVVAVLVGCGGGGPAGGRAVPPAAATPMTTSASLTFIVPLAKSGAARKPSFVSASTLGASISAGGTSTTVDLSPSSGSCSTTASGRTCSLNIIVPFGSVTFTVQTYDQAPVNGAIPLRAHLLAQATTTQTISPTSASVAIVLDPIVADYGSVPSFLSAAADGSTHSYVFAANPVDFGNTAIHNGASDPYANPIAVTVSETGGTAHTQMYVNGSAANGNTGTLRSAADTLSVTYDGGGSPGYGATITFSASGVSSAATTFSPLFVSTTSPAYAHGVLALSGVGSSATFTISELNAPSSSFSAGATGCSNAASVSALVSNAGVSSFTVTGGSSPVSNGCAVMVSDGTATMTFNVTNSIAATATPSPTPTPTPTPTSTPTPTPTPVPSGSPLAGNNLWVEPNTNGPFMTYNVATALAASPNPYTAAANTTFTPAAGMSAYIGLDPVRNIFYEVAGTGVIGVNSGGTGSQPTLMSFAISSPQGIATDSSGNLYVCWSSFPNEYVNIYPYGSTTPTTVMSMAAAGACGGLAIDSSGYIYVADNSNEQLLVYAPPALNAGSVAGTLTRQVTQAQGGFANLWRLALDSTGQIYLLESGSSNCVVVIPGGTTNAASYQTLTKIQAFAAGTATGIAIDANDDIIVTDIYNVLIFKLITIGNAININSNVYYADETINNAAFTNAAGVVAH